MTNKEKLLLIKFLEFFSWDHYNFSCNDVDEKLFNSWSSTEKSNFLKELNEWYDSDFGDITDVQDYVLVDFLSFKLKQEV